MSLVLVDAASLGQTLGQAVLAALVALRSRHLVVAHGARVVFRPARLQHVSEVVLRQGVTLCAEVVCSV